MSQASACPDSLLALRRRLHASCCPPLAEAESEHHRLLLVEQEQRVFEDALEVRHAHEARARLSWESTGREALVERLWRLALLALASAGRRKQHRAAVFMSRRRWARRDLAKLPDDDLCFAARSPATRDARAFGQTARLLLGLDYAEPPH